MKLNLKKVNTVKALEKQGYCTIHQNSSYWGYLNDTENPPGYVLVVNHNKNVSFENSGDSGLCSTPCWSIKEALNIYNNGIFKSNV